MLSANQLAIRASRIGSSEIATIAGLNPFRRPIEVYQEKLNLVERNADETDEDASTKAWGHRMERLIADWYTEELGVELIASPTLTSQKYKWACATPDRLWKDLSRGVEIKNVGQRVAWHWRPEIGGEPDYVKAQVHWQMLVTGLSRWDIVACVGGNSPVIYPVERDETFLAILIAAGADFVARIELEEPPPVDGSDPYRAFLSRLFPSGNGRKRDEEAAELAQEYSRLGQELKTLEDKQEQVANELRARIGDLDEIFGEWGKVSWKANKTGKRTIRVSAKGPTEVEF